MRFGTSIYKQVIGIPMGTNCAPLVADLFLFCYKRDFMLSLSTEHHDDIITAFNNTSRYLDDLFNIDNNHFPSLVYPRELQLNKANTSDKQANQTFLILICLLKMDTSLLKYMIKEMILILI